MARFLIGSIPFVGHVGPILPIARGLVCRGHEVRWYTGARFRESGSLYHFRKNSG